MQTLGFAVFFRDPVVALVGGAAMLPVALAALLDGRRSVAEVVVVGGGIGGLCAALRLGVAGHHVTLLERSSELGGKVAVRERDGFRFDTGPSLLTLPHVFDEVLGLVGMRLADHLDLVRLDPQVPLPLARRQHPRRRRPARATPASPSTGSRPGAGAAWQGWDRRGERIWAIARRTFLAGSMDAPRAVLRRLQRPSDLWAIDGHRSLARAARRTFADDRLVQWAGRYATYSGSSPYAAPATLACIPHIESAYGAWYPRGGMGTLTGVLEEGAARAGVTMRRGAAVARVDASPHQVTGVQLTTGERLAADVVVANTDADHLYRDLLADDRALARVRRAEPSSSAFVILAGARRPDRGRGAPQRVVLGRRGGGVRAALRPTAAARGPDDLRQRARR